MKPVQENGFSVYRVPALDDNYIWLIKDEVTGKAAVVDPAEDAPVEEAMKATGVTQLAYILNTHHHQDHVGANVTLKERHGCTIVGPKADRARIPGIDVELADGDSYDVLGHKMVCLDTPGHTLGHITLLFPDNKALFCGDTLFIMGCGRMFEGNPPMFWNSLSKFLALDPDTHVYCAHEYTASNARFALSIDPDNPALKERAKNIQAMRERGEPTVPGLLQDELLTNPFLRPGDPAIRKALGVPSDADNATAFGAIRTAKDNFRG